MTKWRPLLVLIGVVIIGMYAVGMLAMLFGPASGQFLGIAAFVCMFVYAVIISVILQRSTCTDVADVRYQRLLRYLIGTCFVVFGICFVIVSFYPGVGEIGSAVFDVKPEYRLGAHGRETIVSRQEYLLEVTAFVVGWHAFGISFALSMIYMALYRVDPLQHRP